MVLYSYCIPSDDGAAPNPFWGTCTLAICKPVIRRLAKKGDWIVATGSKKYGFENKVIYIMRVSDIKSFEDYDYLCRKDLRFRTKIPLKKSVNPKRRAGDCIYDFSANPFQQRDGVHTVDNIKRDIGGKRVLLSDHFYYFGSKPIDLPYGLLPIVNQGQGHKSKANEVHVQDFIKWVDTLGKYKNKVNALPYGFDGWEENGCFTGCSKRHLLEDEADERIGDCT